MARGRSAPPSVRLAAAGHVVAVADLDEQAAAATAATLPGDGHLGVAMDVADTDEVDRAMGHVVAAHGPVDVLVNVAGWDRFVPFVDTTPEFWDRVIAINYRGPLNTTRAVLPSMIERQRGRIVSVASGRGARRLVAGVDLRRRQGRSIAFSKSVAREVARYGITVNVVCPGRRTPR